ncbi:Stk1 family PASTA domain-containing Ser/Thr kinase [Nocardioides sp.]|uniref:Stk1 family PASTA domain-containing Ser/Thr kinase n=1 Tax=Nocardioides sp. TaxID=35761 RepID=UPI003518A695
MTDREPQGQLLDGRYRVGPRIARGGMASVHEALDLRLHRTVAVKIMHPGLGDGTDFAARFVREARAAAKLSHPNVVAVYDQGEDDGTVFLAMELVTGHTLRDTISKESPMSPSRALALLEPVVSALAAAHRAGIVHRDVKPENVLIADDGRVKVADFGLAKAVGTDTQHTATGGVLIGTVSYLAPELVAEGTSDARADVYAVGVMLYELLTGTKPHEGDTPIQVAYKHVHEDVPAPSLRASGVPSYVDALVARATARDRSQRPADASVLLHHLHRVSQALSSGVSDDEELTQDLTPLLAAIPAPVADAAPVEEHRVGDTSPEVWEPEELAGLTQPGADPEAATSSGAGATAGAAAPPRPPRPAARPASRPASRSPRQPGRRRRWKGPLVLLLALLLASGVGLGAWWFGWARYETVPTVLGQSRASAIQELEEAGFEVDLADGVYSESVDKNHVVSSSPEPGERVLPGETVTVVLSLGVEKYPVPDLQGLTTDAARAALAEVQLELGRVKEKFSEKVESGLVIRHDPAEGKQLRPGSVVDVVVSKGRRPLNVGDWVGKPADRAQQTLERKGLVVDRSQEQYDNTVPEGFVIAQNPQGGTLFRGETVTLVVSLGPDLVTVPSVRAQGVESARQELEALGFVVETREASGYLGLGYVFSQDPAAGERLPRGSTITLTLI